MNNLAVLQRKIAIRKQLLEMDAPRLFRQFIPYVNPAYSRQWYHTLIADKCQALLEGKIRNLMVFVPPQHGKLLAADTPVLTTKGWKTHGDLQPGDYVFGDDGKPKAVIANSGVYEWNVQRLTFQNGQTILAAKEHLWKFQAEYDDHKGRREIIVETQAIYNRKHRRSPYINCPPKLEMPPRELPIDPYVLGCWLGDGLSNQGVIVSGEQDIEHFAKLGTVKKERKGYYRITVPGLRKSLRLAGMLCNKHIPVEYLLASPQQRQALLQGLMDTDGTTDKRGNCEFTQKRCRLAEDVYVLMRTLGYKARKKQYTAKLNGREVGQKTRITFNPNATDKVFRLPRKAVRLSHKTNADRNDKHKFFLSSISPHGVVEGNCIQVEGGMYLAGEDLIPTHNSEIVSKMFPAWAFGYNPDLKIVGCSYSATLAQQFSRSIQRIMDSPEYKCIFPQTALNASNVRNVTRGYIRNVDLFEIVNHKGFYKTQGVCGGLTGTPVDIAIIDDPVKDAIEAYSSTYRQRVWDWYTSVLLTRLHNESRQLFIMTRWHEDDLAGRILAREADKWEVVSIPAIRETLNDGNPDDPRAVGEALWPQRHSLSRLLEAQQRSARVFTALYQQHPTSDGGNIIKRDWFRYVSREEFMRMRREEPMVFFIDTAFTDKTTNDPTGVIATCRIGDDLYIANARKVNMKFPELVKFIPEYAQKNGYSARSSIRIEPKANGISVIDQLKAMTGLNVTATPSPRDSKETRLNAASVYVECGRVVLVEDLWNDEFVEEVCGFPVKPHDEYVDVLCYAIDHHLMNVRTGIDLHRLSKLV